MKLERAKIGDPFYRYRDPYSLESARLQLETMYVQKVTPAGYWLDFYMGREKSEWKFVLHGEGRRGAYQTKELAKHSYLIRKRRQLLHLARQKQMAEWGIKVAEGKVTPQMMPHIDFFDIHSEDQ